MIRPATAVDAPGIGDIRNTAIRDTTVSLISGHARTAGSHALIGVVAGENTAGLAVHTALGFVPRGTLPAVGRKCGRWLDAVFMQKQL